MCPSPADVQEQDVMLDLIGKSFACLPAIAAALKLFSAGKALQAKLADQKACLKQSESKTI